MNAARAASPRTADLTSRFPDPPAPGPGAVPGWPSPPTLPARPTFPRYQARRCISGCPPSTPHHPASRSRCAPAGWPPRTRTPPRTGGLAHATTSAPVVFEIVDAPGRVGLGVLFFVLVAALVAGAGLGTGRGIDAEFEALAVDVGGQRLHVGEFVVGGDIAGGIAAGFPGIVDVDVDIAGLAHAGLDDGVGHL